MRADVRPRFPDGLTVGDVLMMLRPAFWVRQCGAFAAVRHCAAVAMLALAGIGTFEMCALRLRDWRPGGRDVVMVLRGGRMVRIPVVPELRFVVDRWLKERAKVMRPTPHPDEEPLFVSRRGRALCGQSLSFMLGRLGRRIGLKRHLATMLAHFAASSVEPDRNQAAVDVFLWRRTRNGIPATVTDARLRAMLRRRNPVRGLTRFIYVAELPAGFRKRYGVGVPEHADVRRREKGGWSWYTPDLPKDDPHVAALLAARWPEDETQWPAFRQTLIAEHIEAVVAITLAGKLRAKQAQALFRVSTMSEWLKCQRSRVRPTIRDRRAKRVDAKRHALRPTRQEAALLRKLERFEWPADSNAFLPARRKLAAEHFPALSAMIAGGRLDRYEAGRLLRYHHGIIDKMHVQLVRTGSFGGARLDASLSKSRGWKERIVAAAAARAPGEDVTQACIRFCNDNPDCPYDFKRARMIVYAAGTAQRRAAKNAGA